MTDFTQHDCNFETIGGKSSLNYYLAKRQGINKKALDALIVLHQKKDEIFAEMRSCDDSKTLRLYAQEVTQIYFAQQKLWNFPQDPNFHQFWEMPKCICPTYDNRERIGTDFRIHSNGCPIHGAAAVEEQREEQAVSIMEEAVNYIKDSDMTEEEAQNHMIEAFERAKEIASGEDDEG